MDEFDKAQERYEKRHGKPMPPPVVIRTESQEEKVIRVESPTPKRFTVLCVDITNGDTVHRMSFEADDLLENMMHSDRTYEGIRDRIFTILKTHLTSGLR